MAEQRLIDAIAYYKELKEEMDYPGRSEEFMIAIDVAIADLADAPTIDAAPVVHGRWIETPSFAPEYGCSECGQSYEWWESSEAHYCPNCGAKMDM